MDGSRFHGFAEAPCLGFAPDTPAASTAALWSQGVEETLLALGKRFRVRCLELAPGAALSLQSHLHRAEHWVVVQGTARVTLAGQVRLISESQSIHVPLGQVHRLENPGFLPMVLIEVQTGSYLGEDDIVRHDDIAPAG